MPLTILYYWERCVAEGTRPESDLLVRVANRSTTGSSIRDLTLSLKRFTATRVRCIGSKRTSSYTIRLSALNSAPKVVDVSSTTPRKTLLSTFSKNNHGLYRKKWYGTSGRSGNCSSIDRRSGRVLREGFGISRMVSVLAIGRIRLPKSYIKLLSKWYFVMGPYLTNQPFGAIGSLRNLFEW